MLRNLLFSGMLLLASSMALEAQTLQGSQMVGGQGTLAGVFREGSDRFEFSLSPDYGYFVLDNFAVGAFLDFSFISVEALTSRFRFALKPFVRYYVPSESKWRFFVNGSIGGGIDRLRLDEDLLQEIDPDAENPTIRGLVEFDVGPGVNFFLSRSVALEGYVFYEGTQREGEEDLTSRFGLRLGLQAFLFQRDND